MPSATLPDQVGHVMWNKNAVESPDSAQPKPSQEGLCSSPPLRDCSAARKVPAPVGAAARLGEEGGVVGPVIGPEVLGLLEGVVGPVIGAEVLGVPAGEDAAELVEELQAVNRTAIHARDAQDAICRGLPALVISIVSKPFNQ
jgi:hypothetical protein